MTATLALARRTRRHVHSFDDLNLLVRVLLVMALLPVAIRLPWPRLLGGLDVLSRVLAVAPGPRAERVDFYVRACGAQHWGPFQDNCFARSLTRFALLNQPALALDVVLGVSVIAQGDDGPGIARRHVWLTTADGRPFLENESVEPYVVQFRYREGAPMSAGAAGLGRFVARLSASGVASSFLAVASVARTKLVAVFVGPAGLALSGQMASAVTALGWVASFGGGGTARFVAEALERGRPGEAATVVRTTVVLLGATSFLLVAVGVLTIGPLALALFGNPSAGSWVAWLLLAVPLAALASVSTAVLQGSQQVGRLATAQSLAAFASVGLCVLLVRPGDPALVIFVPLAVTAVLSVAAAAAAWPVCRPWLSAGGRWFAGAVARGIAAYGIANVVMGLATAVAFLAIGRHYLAAGDLETAGRIAALAWLGEPLALALTAGHQATTYPAYAAARGRAAEAVLARAIRGLVIVSTPILLLGSMAAPVLVVLVFSSAFDDITVLVALRLLATYLRSATIVLGLPLFARGHLTSLTVLHAVWAAGSAAGALVWAGPGLAGATAFVASAAVAASVHLIALLVVLRAYGLAPARRDLVWLAAGAAPLVWMAIRP